MYLVFSVAINVYQFTFVKNLYFCFTETEQILREQTESIEGQERLFTVYRVGKRSRRQILLRRHLGSY